MSKPMTTEYALYKGEKLLSMGTAEEIAEEMGVSIDTVYWWHSPTNKINRASKKLNNRKVLVKIEDDEGED